MLICSRTKSSIPASESCSNKSKVLIFPEIPAVRPGLVWTWTLPVATVSLSYLQISSLYSIRPTLIGFPSQWLCQIDKTLESSEFNEGREIALSGGHKIQGVTSHGPLHCCQPRSGVQAIFRIMDNYQGYCRQTCLSSTENCSDHESCKQNYLCTTNQVVVQLGSTTWGSHLYPAQLYWEQQWLMKIIWNKLKINNNM